jgi:hypothetical protein
MNHISWMKYISRLYFSNDLYFILRFHEFSWMNFHPNRMASSLHSHINGYKENIRFELKPFNLLSIHSKNQLEGSLNFERGPIKLQITLKSNGFKIEREK